MTRSKTKFWRGAAWAAAVAMSGGVLGNLAFLMVPGQPGLAAQGLTAAAIALGVFILALGRLKSLADEALSSRARVSTDPSNPKLGARPVLIMGLSPLSAPQQTSIRADIGQITAGAFGVEQVALPVKAFLALQKEWQAQAKPVPTATLWQQNIRSMWWHSGPGVPASRRLRRVIVLPSQESLGQFGLFEAYVGALFKGEVSVDYVRHTDASGDFFHVRHGEAECRDYEVYDYVRDGLDQAKEQATGGQSSDGDICIDVTPGQKTFSIAAAILTLNTNAVFSYVTTGQPGSDRGGEVRQYDAHIDTSFSS